MFARNCDIDYTGDIEFGDNVCILEGAKILTHAHDYYHFMKETDLIPFSNRAYKTNLKIGQRALICARAVILPGVNEIGEGSIIQAGAVVDKSVPPNVIVAGVPAKVVRKIPSILRKKKE
jgi:acetyltransferase-like isoleucine patch superfamily enzyme